MSAGLHSALYKGIVRHRRTDPVPHAFDYRVFMIYLDLDELDVVFRRRWLWSTRGPAMAWFRRRDHLGDPGQPLATSVRDLVQSRVGVRPAGPIRLLTNLRYFGYCMNPVSFYYCFDEREGSLEFIVAEVHNTPWGERHCYVLDASRNVGTATTHRYRFDKTFHVSPFMGMDQAYDWRLTPPGDALRVHTENLEGDVRLFDATLVLERQPLTGTTLARALIRYPWMTARIVAAIYYQALRLRLKRVPFHPHPKHRLATKAGA